MNKLRVWEQEAACSSYRYAAPVDQPPHFREIAACLPRHARQSLAMDMIVQDELGQDDITELARRMKDGEFDEQLPDENLLEGVLFGLGLSFVDDEGQIKNPNIIGVW